MKTDLQPTLNWDIRLEPVTVNNSFDTGKNGVPRVHPLTRWMLHHRQSEAEKHREMLAFLLEAVLIF